MTREEFPDDLVFGWFVHAKVLGWFMVGVSTEFGFISSNPSPQSKKIISFECVHVSRNCNKAAHVLAALGVGGVEGEEHVSCNPPDSVVVIVADDLSSLGQ